VFVSDTIPQSDTAAVMPTRATDPSLGAAQSRVMTIGHYTVIVLVIDQYNIVYTGVELSCKCSYTPNKFKLPPQ